jgi:ABC-2 type transport system permease protein
MIKALWGIIRREFRSFFHTPIAIAILFGGPLFFGILIGMVYDHAKPVDLPIIVVDKDGTPMSGDIIDALNDNQYIKVWKVAGSEFEARQYLKTQKVEGIVTIPANFESDINQKRCPEIQVDLNTVNILTSNYINTGILKTLGTINAGVEINTMEKGGMPAAIAEKQYQSFSINTDRFYNPESNYLRFLWPGITGGILQQIFLLVIAIIFSKEFEKKIFGQLLTYSKSTNVILLGKTIPYILVMMAIWLGMLYIMYPAFKIEIVCGFAPMFLFSFIFIICLLAMGIMVSLIFPTMLLSTEILMIVATPSFIVSGYTWPITQMPVVVQGLANLLPLTHFLSGFRKLAFMGDSLHDVWHEIFMMLMMILVYGTISWVALWIRIRREKRKYIPTEEIALQGMA